MDKQITTKLTFEEFWEYCKEFQCNVPSYELETIELSFKSWIKMLANTEYVINTTIPGLLFSHNERELKEMEGESNNEN